MEGALEVNGAVDIDNTLDLEVNIGAVAMDVENTNTGSSSVAIKATGRTALEAHGHVALDSNKALTMDGTSGQNYMTYNSANSRFEFYVGGTLRFIIDSTGGHNP